MRENETQMRDSKKEKKKEIGEREVEKGDIDDIERERERNGGE